MIHRVLPFVAATLVAACGAPLHAAEPFFPGAPYDAGIAHPDKILGFETGIRPANHAQIEACMKAWASTPRSRLFEYAKSHEGKTLYYLVISSARNIARLEAIKADLASLADPRKVSAAEGDQLAATLPAVAWMAYVIHGDEVSGSDASLVMAHHLIASTDPKVEALLENIVVIVDPLMNPDGRDRYLSQLAHDRTTQPNVDDQSVLHSRPWPAGRTNHYLFDMNRDWIVGTQPESRGRIAAIGSWHPQLLMESHEMGSQDTFLFSPPREPVNPNLAPTMRKWWDVFGNDLATSFDAHNWRYYHGEWNEEWYPGYSSAWAGYRGCIDILFEQASIATDGVKKASGVIETYRESVHHQLVGSMSNIQTLAKHRQDVLKDYLAQRRYAVAADSTFANRTFAIPASANSTRLRELVELLKLQGFELFMSQQELTASGKDQLGQEVQNVKLPAGTILIPNRQPEARLLAAMLEFDTRMTPEFLQEERRELLRFGRSRLYDITGWSISMLHDLPAYELSLSLPADATPYAPAPKAPANWATTTPTAWLIDGQDDASVAAAAQLMERGVTCRVINKPTILGTTRLSRGSIIIAQADN
ncbi:MAG: M14 family zinc carboxypeptidase, partial [Planctomycetota bacterium]|nr:M14 family zinc carboxypeptidase [Planctomycetota bacterium]